MPPKPINDYPLWNRIIEFARSLSPKTYVYPDEIQIFSETPAEAKRLQRKLKTKFPGIPLELRRFTIKIFPFEDRKETPCPQ